MGKMYSQLGLNERIEIYRLHAGGKSRQAIGAILGRSPSTICRELKRNSKRTRAWRRGYDPVRAQALAERRRRWDGRYKLMRQPDLRDLVKDRLAMGWSPEQISGRLTLENAGTTISHESIYRYAYHCSASKNYWHRLLPRQKHRRGRLGKRGGSPASRISGRRPLSERPVEAADRRTPGHWEADFMLFARYGQGLLVLHERHSRMTLISAPPNRRAEPTVQGIVEQLEPLDPALRRSISFDNGTEFAAHLHLTDRLGIQTFFCDPHSPWQKGGVENAIGRLRRNLPRRTDLSTISTDQLQAIARRFNQTPRKCLDFRSPAEAFSQLQSSVALQT
jgi:IS30 family transposase